MGEIAKKLASSEEQKKLYDLRDELYKIIEEKFELQEENQDLKKRLNLKENLYFKNNMYWLKKENDIVGPYCSKCYDKDNKLVHFHTDDNYYRCPVCNFALNEEGKRERPMPRKV